MGDIKVSPLLSLHSAVCIIVVLFESKRNNVNEVIQSFYVMLRQILYLLLLRRIASSGSSYDDDNLNKGHDDGEPTRIALRKQRSLVIGGDETVEDRYAYAQISIQFPWNMHACGASLVAPDMIMTAAHCTLNNLGDVLVGKHNVDDPSGSYETLFAIKTFVHPWFNESSLRFDFALVQLNNKVTQAQPVRLNMNPEFPEDNQMLTLLGWGAVNFTYGDKPVFADTLQEATIPYMPNDECRNYVAGGTQPNRNELFDEMMCAYAQGIDACDGDSGSPLMIKAFDETYDIQVGLVSWGRGCGEYPGVYSRISSAYSWIRSQICFHSVAPQDDLQCSSSERDPLFLQTNPTDAPAFAFPIEIPDWTAAPGKASGGENEGLIEATLQIQLDGKSEEISWYVMSDNDELLAGVNAGHYTTSNKLVRESFLLDPTQMYTLVIQDKGGDGLCCESLGANGWYLLSVRVPQGEDILVVLGEGEFQSHALTSFVINEVLSQRAEPIFLTYPQSDQLRLTPMPALTILLLLLCYGYNTLVQ